jgi:error-prone DNA polymerase
MPLGEEVVNDYRFLQLTLRKHPAAFLRPDLGHRGIILNEELRRRASGERVTVSGLIIIRQRPGTAKGVLFMTLEDETAVANVIIWPKTFERFRPVVLGARYVAVTGPMQAESGVIHVVTERIDDLTPLLGRLAEEGTTIEGLARCDEVKRPGREEREKQGPRRTPLIGLLTEMPELFADLDVPAHGSHHTVPKARRGVGPY